MVRTILPLPAEVAISLVFMVVMTFVGAAVFHRVERRCRLLGTLGLP